MSERSQTTILAAVIIIVCLASIVYVYEIDPRTREANLINNAKRSLHVSETDEYLGSHLYYSSDHASTVYTWRNQTTLMETQVTQGGQISYLTYQLKQDELNLTMSPLLAQELSHGMLEQETRNLPDNVSICEPTFVYEDESHREGSSWTLIYGLKLGNYTVIGADLLLQVMTQTGEPRLKSNTLNNSVGLTMPKPPSVSQEQAVEICKNSFCGMLEYAVIQSVEVRRLGVASGGMSLVPANALIWVISIQGMGYENGAMTHESTSYSVDAHTGKNYGGLSVGSGAIMSIGSYPYYGSAYPVIVNNYPEDYDFPVTLGEAKDLIYNHSLYGLPEDLAWEYVELTLGEGVKPVIVSYWTRVMDGYKVGTVRSTYELVSETSGGIDVLDGFLMVIDAETGILLEERGFRDVGVSTNKLLITREQAINVTATSPLADPSGNMVSPSNLVLAEPRVIKSDWSRQLGDFEDYDRIYIADSDETETRVYWQIEYEKTMKPIECYTATYLVDGETGQLVLALEDLKLPSIITVKPR